MKFFPVVLSLAVPALSVDQYGPCGTPPNPTDSLFQSSCDVFIEAIAGEVGMDLVQTEVALLEGQSETKACGECLDTYMIGEFNTCNSTASTDEDVGYCLGNATLDFYNSCMPLVPTSDACSVLEFLSLGGECADLGDGCYLQVVKDNITDPTCGMCIIHNIVQPPDNLEDFFCVPSYDSVMYTCSNNTVSAWLDRFDKNSCDIPLDGTNPTLAQFDCLFDPVQPVDCQNCLLWAMLNFGEASDDNERRSLVEEELFYGGCLESNAPTTPTAPTIPATPTTPTMPTIPAPTAPAAAPTNPSSSATKSILAMAVGAITIVASIVVVA